MLDDFSMDLVQTMRSVQRMRKTGASYPHSFVTDSLCCVSRSSFFTGQYPHQTGVRTNTANTPNPVGPVGGWEALVAERNRLRATGHLAGIGIAAFPALMLFVNRLLDGDGRATSWLGACTDIEDIRSAAITLREIDGLSYEEIAKILDCSIGTVSSRLNRGHKLLAEKLGHLRGEI